MSQALSIAAYSPLHATASVPPQAHNQGSIVNTTFSDMQNQAHLYNSATATVGQWIASPQQQQQQQAQATTKMVAPLVAAQPTPGVHQQQQQQQQFVWTEASAFPYSTTPQTTHQQLPAHGGRRRSSGAGGSHRVSNGSDLNARDDARNGGESGEGKDGANPLHQPDDSNLIVNYIPIEVGDEELKQLFEQYGKVTNSRIIRDGQGFTKGFGFVKFETAEAAAKCLEAMNGFEIHGKRLRVNIARPTNGVQTYNHPHFRQNQQLKALQKQQQQQQQQQPAAAPGQPIRGAPVSSNAGGVVATPIAVAQGGAYVVAGPQGHTQIVHASPVHAAGGAPQFVFAPHAGLAGTPMHITGMLPPQQPQIVPTGPGQQAFFAFGASGAPGAPQPQIVQWAGVPQVVLPPQQMHQLQHAPFAAQQAQHFQPRGIVVSSDGNIVPDQQRTGGTPVLAPQPQPHVPMVVGDASFRRASIDSLASSDPSGSRLPSPSAAAGGVILPPGVARLPMALASQQLGSQE